MWLLLTAVRQAEQAQAAAQLFKALCCSSKMLISNCVDKPDQSTSSRKSGLHTMNTC